MHLIPDFKYFCTNKRGAGKAEQYAGSTPDTMTDHTKPKKDLAVKAPYLLELLHSLRTNVSSDPRDKIYALLGLADDEIARSIIPDYFPENTTSRLFIDVACRFISARHGTELLSYAGLDQQI
ncbi:hypothetical protein F5Y19DRAFT_418812 [Xylariaceae sp. FL1651]|nr:hypothetical protein F5Y19DRAFT_418812 [Xylariaceae sp. FL1651]